MDGLILSRRQGLVEGVGLGRRWIGGMSDGRKGKGRERSTSRIIS
jgi:hypothetical protein